MMKINHKKLIKLIEKKEYGEALDNLLELPNDYTDNLGSKRSSNYYLAIGILWELLENYPKAQEKYEIALDKNPDNIISLQYLAHILSMKGEYPKALLIFDKFFQKRKEGNKPFNINRGFLGFRYRLLDINLLENLEVTEKEIELKNILLSIYYLSVFDLEKSLKYFKKLKRSNSELEILKLITKYQYFKKKKFIKQLSNIKLEEKNQLSKQINILLKELPLINHDAEFSSFLFNPRVPDNLYDLTKDVQGWLDYCEGNLLYQISKSLESNKIPIYIVEIGSFLGRSTVFIAQGLKERGEGILFSVDPHDGIPYYHPEPTIDDFLKNINKANVKEFIQVLRGTSKEWSSKINEEISMLFIDGDHNYEMVKSDFDNWENKLTSGGYIAFHDAVLDGPFNVILEMLKSNQWEFLLIVGNIALLRKASIKQKYKEDVFSILNLILLHINRSFHLNFILNDKSSIEKQFINLMRNMNNKNYQNY